MNYRELIRIKKNDKLIKIIFIFSILIIFILFIYHSDIKENIDFMIYLLKIKLNLYNEYWDLNNRDNWIIDNFRDRIKYNYQIKRNDKNKYSISKLFLSEFSEYSDNRINKE